jgi:hypothetical protein
VSEDHDGRARRERRDILLQPFELVISEIAEAAGLVCGARDRSAPLGWMGFIKLPGSTALRQTSKGVPSSTEP